MSADGPGGSQDSVAQDSCGKSGSASVRFHTDLVLWYLGPSSRDVDLSLHFSQADL